MNKQHRDFVVYVRDGVEINALVVFSRTVVPAVQSNLPRSLRLAAEAAASEPEEHLTLVYLKPSSASVVPSGDQIRDSIMTQFDVRPLGSGVVTGWKEIVDADAEAESIEGSPREKADPEAYARVLYLKSKRIEELEVEAKQAVASKEAQDAVVVALQEKVKELEEAATATAINQAKTVPAAGEAINAGNSAASIPDGMRALTPAEMSELSISAGVAGAVTDDPEGGKYLQGVGPAWTVPVNVPEGEGAAWLHEKFAPGDTSTADAAKAE